MNTDLRKKAKTDFEKYFFKLMKNAVFGKNYVVKHGDIKLVTTERRRHYLLSQTDYHTLNISTENVLQQKWEKQRYL